MWVAKRGKDEKGIGRTISALTEGYDRLVSCHASCLIHFLDQAGRSKRSILIQMIAPEYVNGTRYRAGAPRTFFGPIVFRLSSYVDDYRRAITNGLLNVETRRQ